MSFDQKIKDLLSNAYFDSLAVAFINFDKKSSQKFYYNSSASLYYDLASVSKLISLGSYCLAQLDNKQEIDTELRALIEHRAGLPAWSILSNKNWQSHLNSLSLKPGKTLYSDLSALRAQLEIEKKEQKSLKELVKSSLNSNIFYFTDFNGQKWASTGSQNFRVHDPNAFNINKFVSHAGYFSTLEGVCDWLFNLDQKFSFIDVLKSQFQTKKDRFLFAWDTVNSSSSLAGSLYNKDEMVVGHLGFTGTSLWVNLNRKIGVVVLSNATQNYWYERDILNQIRRLCGSIEDYYA